MESEEPSLETTVPTDEPVSSCDEVHAERNGDGLSGRRLLERKQLQHDLQLCRYELSRRDLVIDNMKAENITKVDELEERLNDALHQKRILQTQLDTRLTLQQEEANSRQERVHQELETILDKQRKLEDTNRDLRLRAGVVRRSLRDLEITSEQYSDLRILPEEELSIRDFVALQFYEALQPLQKECDELHERKGNLAADLSAVRSQLQVVTEQNEEEQRVNAGLKAQCQRLYCELKESKRVNGQDALGENYDLISRYCTNVSHLVYLSPHVRRALAETLFRNSTRFGLGYADQNRGDVVALFLSSVCRDRDDLRRQLTELKSRQQEMATLLEEQSKERARLALEAPLLRQSVDLLQRDKTYLERQATELESKNTLYNQRITQLENQLQEAARAREDAYEKYTETRHSQKVEYEARLNEELERIRRQTELQLERLRVTVTEVHERENRNLREARDRALAEQERARESEMETKKTHENLREENCKVQLSAETRVSELQAQLQMRSFEAERAQLLHEEVQKALEQSCLECQRSQEKLEVLTKEFYGVEAAREREGLELKTRLAELQHRLDPYEQLEKELDETVMQAAEVEDGTEAERIIFSSSDVPTTTRRRFKQSVKLARRVLQLQRLTSDLHSQLEKNHSELDTVNKELNTVNGLLASARQPHAFLIERARERENENLALRKRLTDTEEHLGRCQNEKAALQRSKDDMAADLERLLNQHEEVAIMKRMVLGMRDGIDGLHSQMKTDGGNLKFVPEPHDKRRPLPTRFVRQFPFSSLLVLGYTSLQLCVGRTGWIMG
uniref:Progesterone immunomodulatory binding factor 1 n=1 Tax=Eptatretus burgeri TaxID=7764 RepID=A0A8C4NMH6_EPTBU